MKPGGAWRWLGIGLLAAGLSLAPTGCSNDDDVEAGGTTVVTNVVNGTTVVVTNATPAADNDDDDDGGNQPPALVAPQLISPQDGERLESVQLPLVDVNVRFEWTAVNGAAGYILDVDGSEYPVNGTSTTIGFGIGDHTWTVRARGADGTRGVPARPYTFTCAQIFRDDLLPPGP